MTTNTLQQQVTLANAKAATQKLAVGQRPTETEMLALGACGSPWLPMRPGAAPSNPSLPTFAPHVPPDKVVRSDQVLAEAYAPLGVRQTAAAVAGTITTLLIAPIAGLFSINGVKSCNPCDEIDITLIHTSNSSVQRNAGTFDWAAFNTVECFCPVDWGCTSQQAPLRLSFTAVTVGSTPPVMSGTLWGVKYESFNSCYAGIPAILSDPGR